MLLTRLQQCDIRGTNQQQLMSNFAERKWDSKDIHLQGKVLKEGRKLSSLGKQEKDGSKNTKVIGRQYLQLPKG